MAYPGAVSSPLWGNLKVTLPLTDQVRRQEYFVRSDFAPNANDVVGNTRLTDLGNLFVAAVSATACSFDVFAEYDFTFLLQNMESAHVGGYGITSYPDCTASAQCYDPEYYDAGQFVPWAGVTPEESTIPIYSNGGDDIKLPRGKYMLIRVAEDDTQVNNMGSLIATGSNTSTELFEGVDLSTSDIGLQINVIDVNDDDDEFSLGDDSVTGTYLDSAIHVIEIGTEMYNLLKDYGLFG
jgi:hypothetical protein